jgi:hypothetical protein
VRDSLAHRFHAGRLVSPDTAAIFPARLEEVSGKFRNKIRLNIEFLSDDLGGAYRATGRAIACDTQTRAAL